MAPERATKCAAMTMWPIMNEGLELTVSVPCRDWIDALPTARKICRRAARAAFRADAVPTRGAEASLVLADDVLVRSLNREYRGDDRPTNVLSFANLDGDDVAVPGQPVMLGDIVVAFQIAAAEAARQGKSLGDHLSHLVVHGMLHLLGCGHESDADAERMERLEIGVLSGLGVASPYTEPQR